MVTRRSDGKTHLAFLVRQMPRYLARAIDTYADWHDLPNRSAAVIALLESHPEVKRCLEHTRLEARRIAHQQKTQQG